LEIPATFGAATLRCVPELEALPAIQKIPAIVELAHPLVTTIADEPWAMAAVVAWTPAEPNRLYCTAPKLHIDAPFIGCEANYSRPAEGNHGERNQRFSKRSHAM
jgi:hypothetical protein